MPLSLRAKLAAIDQPVKKPPSEASQPLYIKDSAYSLAIFDHMDEVNGPLISAMEGLPYPELADPRRILYLDTETTGLASGAGTVAFLVGVGFLTDTQFTVRQFLMRDYSQEGQLLRQLMAMLPDFDAIVTFNGKSFDIPLLQSRLIMNRLDSTCLELPHLDLLHLTRRTFKLRMNRCRLADVEAEIFHEPRKDDLPGALVPQRYFDYLKTGNFSLLTDILDHNAQDIASLCRLLGHLAHMYAHPETQAFPEDVFSMGAALEKRCQTERACKCYRLASRGKLAAPSHMRLGVIYRRMKDYPQALEHFSAMARSNPGSVVPWIEMAKIYEHRLRNVDAALNCTRRAILILSEPQLTANPSVQSLQNELQYRYMRLMCKHQGKRGNEP